MSPFWKHIVIAAAIFVVVSLFARAIDWWLQRRPPAPEAMTRYRVFRRIVSVVILTVGLFSALLAIPEVRAVAGDCSHRRRSSGSCSASRPRGRSATSSPAS